ncbi:toxin-antitoxin system HicB family antitoxin [uncultured Jatrophihabitans sp.]|uniref:toxin-antitoxin system HicB family antitoxin n=1 Tax=uncultured Jatrophihabitans sp. TaxID=1610747 RepID=UPI0035C955FE
MQLSPIVSQVHDQLTAAAALGDERTQHVAASLAAAAGPAVRLAVLEALSAAADEITAALLDHPGSPAVSVRVNGSGGAGGEDVLVSVRDTASVPSAEPRTDDGDSSARISLRLSESLKTDVEQAAAKEGVSVNTWLVRAAGAALEPNPFAALGAFGRGLGRAAGRGGWPGGGDRGPGGPPEGPGGSHSRISGWIDG